MNIDVSALKQFQATFGPLLTAIPAVLDALAHEADMDRALAAKRRELEELQGKIANTASDLQMRVDSAAQLVKLEQDKLKEVKQAIRDEREAAVATAKRDVDAAVKALQELEAKRAAVASDLRELDAAFAAKHEALNVTFSKESAVLLSEIAELTTRKEAAASALEEIRVKLG